MKEERKVLEVVQETEILGKRIMMYGNINLPWFLAKDVAEWIDYQFIYGKKVRNTSKMLKLVDDEDKNKAILGIPTETNPSSHGGLRENTEMWFLTEDGLYEVCMQSRKPIAKEMKKEIKAYLKSIRLTGAAIPVGREEEMISKYFPSFSKEIQTEMVKDLVRQNTELKQFYDDLMNTEGLMSMNVVSKELGGFGLKRLFSYLRIKKIMFYKDGVNIPFQRFMEQGLFQVRETPCQDGNVRSVTYATKKGLDYIRRLLRKEGYSDVLDTSYSSVS